MSTLPPGATILQVTPALDAGGVEQTTLDMAEAIVAAGGRALVASRGGRMAQSLKACDGELFEMPLDRKGPLTLWRARRDLERLIRAENVDLVHVRSRAPAFPALAAARAVGVPVVATYHGVYNARSALKRWYNGVMTRGDLTIANSDYTARHVIATHRVDPARVIPIARGVDLRRYDPAAVSAERVAEMRTAWGIAADEIRPVLLLAGRLTRWKGQALAIEALAAAGRPAVLVLAGDDQGRSDYTAELKALAKDKGVGAAVRFVGHVADMPAAYAAADLALAPSLEPEAFGRTAVEPQAMARPVLAADHGAATETVEPGVTGWLVPAGDVRAWTTALLTALEAGPQAWAAMGAAGRARVVERYGLKRMTDATLAVYARLLQERR